jgi:hypothetical protein
MFGSAGTSAPIFITQDTGAVLRYESYPVTPTAPGTWTDLGGGTAGSAGVPVLAGSGSLQPGWPMALDLAHAPPGAPLLLWLSLAPAPVAKFGGTLHALPAVAQVLLMTDGAGTFHAGATWPAGLPSGLAITFQALIADPSVPPGLVLGNGLRATLP